jgi:hypothetical protein
VSRRIRALRQPPRELTPEEITALRYQATGQASNLDEEVDDYLAGPSMASVLMKQSQGDYLRTLMQQMEKEGQTGARSSVPMIASILQLDRP